MANIIALSLVSFLEALQVLIILVLLFSFVPIPVPAYVQKFYPLSQYVVHLERESFFYHVWIAVALGLQGLLVFVHRGRLAKELLWREFLPYICAMAGIVSVQVFAVFKIFLWGDPWWARGMLYAFIGFGVLVRMFWPECRRSIGRVWHQAGRSIPWRGRLLMDGGAWLVLMILVFAPDVHEVLARMFSYDKFYHLDGFLMSPAWAYHNGLVLDKDVISQYSLIIPIVFNGLMALAGGFDYAHAVGIAIGLSAAYYVLLYGLWRYWTTSFGLSFFAVVLAIKLQFFHWGVTPLVWAYLTPTPLRSLPDVFFIFFILRFTQTIGLRWLFAAACASGLGLVWTVDVGMYMYAVLLLAAAAAVYARGRRIMAWSIGAVLLPWGIAGGVLYLFYGPLIGQGFFWHNVFEHASMFLQGWGALPITDGLKDGQFFAFCMGFVIPAVYTGTLVYSLGMFLFRRSGPHLFMVLISAYGLGLYHYFIHRSGVTSYYAVIVPFIFVLLFWARAAIGLCEERWQRAVKLFLCAWALTALATGYLFTYYPNFLNLSGHDWSSEKKFYDQNFDFSRDASLIDALTVPREPVALISSFETKILMQADRPPFFYYFPMVESEHMQGDRLRGIYIHTYARLARTLKQLQERQPSHVFIQTRLFQGPQAQSYEDSHEGFKQLMAYIRMHYQYQDQGQYLTALKLK